MKFTKLEYPHEFIAKNIGDKTLNSIMMIIAVIGLTLIIMSFISLEIEPIIHPINDLLFILYLICFISKKQKEINQLRKSTEEKAEE